jgi:hypothetical protein
VVEQAELLALKLEIEELRKSQEWISVEDRLPELEKTYYDLSASNIVLVVWQYDNYSDQGANEIKEWEETTKAYIVGNCWVNLENGNEIPIDEENAPKLWQPLPSPPTEEA